MAENSLRPQFKSWCPCNFWFSGLMKWCFKRGYLYNSFKLEPRPLFLSPCSFRVCCFKVLLDFAYLECQPALHRSHWIYLADMLQVLNSHDHMPLPGWSMFVSNSGFVTTFFFKDQFFRGSKIRFADMTSNGYAYRSGLWMLLHLNRRNHLNGRSLSCCSNWISH